MSKFKQLQWVETLVSDISHIAYAITTQTMEPYGSIHTTYITQGQGGKYFFEEKLDGVAPLLNLPLAKPNYLPNINLHCQ